MEARAETAERVRIENLSRKDTENFLKFLSESDWKPKGPDFNFIRSAGDRKWTLRVIPDLRQVSLHLQTPVGTSAQSEILLQDVKEIEFNKQQGEIIFRSQGIDYVIAQSGFTHYLKTSDGRRVAMFSCLD
jgi:hypothetical protein